MRHFNTAASAGGEANVHPLGILIEARRRDRVLAALTDILQFDTDDLMRAIAHRRLIELSAEAAE